MTKTARLGVVLLCAAASTAALAQAWPARTIRIVVPTAPGGGPDVVARYLAPRLTEVLGQQVVIDNRAGANAMIGAEVVARAPADGYTWLFGTGQNTVNPSVMKKVPHDIVDDFAPVSLVYQSTYLLVVHPTVPAKSVAELVALARAQPDRLNYGSGGIGSAAHLSAEMLRMMTGVRMVHVPFKGMGFALTDLLGGQLDLMFPAVPSVLPYHKAGRLRGLGVTSPRRHPSAPELPTMAETLPGFESRSWIGVLMPAGTPRDIVTRVNAVLVKLVGSTEVRQALIAQGADPETNTPEEFARYIRQEVARAARVVKAAGIRPE
ncbi:MAG: tripartite tricarboxylate transporter substrate binding protein [Gammaproteobacteria bacterium]|nr:tripartite tricarboxylate transporter substrate binding protein [Gammaproteobacteria bacterium]